MMALTLSLLMVSRALDQPSWATDRAALGGPGTVEADGTNAFSLPAPGLTREQRRAFSVGNAFFRENWVIAPASVGKRDGLGPLFNANSCSACHHEDGRGRPPLAAGEVGVGMVVFVSPRDRDGEPHPIYGGQIQDQAIPGVAPEARVLLEPVELPGRYPDGTAYSLRRWTLRLADEGYGPLGNVRLSPRLGQQLIGMGLLEAIDDATLISIEDPDDLDGDGISGRAHRVRDGAGPPRIGRFGWKASQPTIEAQVIAALHGDIGITSTARPEEPLTAHQRRAVSALSTAPAIPAPPAKAEVEVDDFRISRIAHYCRVLAVPRQRHAERSEVARGRELFTALGCAACHRPEFTTGQSSPIDAFRGVVIRPYTDLLLHDMGPGLADDRRDGEATGSEWRTPPLWGIGLLPTVSDPAHYLHDGRARSLEEAILWHGGEAQAARDAFVERDAAARAALLAFLESL
jgi:CxxC motif-containing protein (DUF1111 family)